MQGDKDCIVIAEGIHMLNPLMLRQAPGHRQRRVCSAPDPYHHQRRQIVRPEQLRVARRLIRDYNTRGHSLQDTVERAESVDRGEVNYIMPHKSQRRHPHRHLPRLRALHSGQVPQRNSPVPPGADAGVSGKARPDGSDEGGGRSSAAAHGTMFPATPSSANLWAAAASNTKPHPGRPAPPGVLRTPREVENPTFAGSRMFRCTIGRELRPPGTLGSALRGRGMRPPGAPPFCSCRKMARKEHARERGFLQSRPSPWTLCLRGWLSVRAKRITRADPRSARAA
jgi:hypothetical protein